MAQSYSKENDCLLIYNHEDSGFSDGRTREGNSLLLSYVNFVDRKLKSCKYRINHHDRDSIPGRSVFNELERVIESSHVVLLIVDKGFLKNSWVSFLKDMTIKKLICDSKRPGFPGSNRFIPIFINLEKNEIPFELSTSTCIHIMNESDIMDEEKWLKLKKALSDYFKNQSCLPVSMQHNLPRTPEYPNTSGEPSGSRVNPGSNDSSSRSTLLPNKNSFTTTSDSFSTEGEQRHQEKNSKESETNQFNMNRSSLSNCETPVREQETPQRRTLSLESTDLEVDAQKSMLPLIPSFHVTERESFDPETDVNQNLEAPVEAHGGGVRQQESLDMLAVPLNASTSSASRSSLNRPIVTVLPYRREKTNADNGQRTSGDTMHFSNSLPDNIDSLQ